MEETKTAKEAIWSELQCLMAKQLTEGPLSAEELRHMDRLGAALNALGAPEEDGSAGALLNAYRQLALMRAELEDSRGELRRIALLLKRHSRRRRRARMGLAAAVGLAGLWLGMSLVLMVLFRWLDTFTVRALCGGSVAGLALAVFAFQKRLERSEPDWMDGEEEDEDFDFEE